MPKGINQLYYVAHLIQKILKKLFFYSKYIFSIPITIFIYIISPLYKIKFFALFSERIGHYALNTELMLCTLETQPTKKNCFYIFYTRPTFLPLCNTQLHRMWKRVIYIFPFPVVAEQTDSLLKLLLGKTYKQEKIKVTFESASGANDPLGLLQKIQTPHLKFTLKEIAQGERLISTLGVSHHAKIVCLIVRDSAYLNAHLPGLDWSYHNFRDVDVDTFKLTALFLAEKGYYVVRMGKVVEKKFDVQHERIIDYATSELRSDFMDIYLLSRCNFFISTVTGLDCVPQIFRRPGLFTNVVLPGELLPWYPNRLFIPKKIRDKITRKILPFNTYYEIFNMSQDKLSMMAFLKKHQLEVIQNTEIEILDVVKEMENLINLNIDIDACKKNDALQNKFWERFPKKIGSEYYIRIGSAFLEKILF